MILTVTLNAALDVTYRLPTVTWGGTNRVREVTSRAGGKGINVTRLLHTLGEETVATGLVGGGTGEEIRADLRACGLDEALVGVRDESRRTLAVVETDGGTATLLNEPGPRIGDEEWHGFVERFRELAGTADAVVLSGSLPPGAPADAYAVLAHEAGDVPVVLDADGETLRQGVAGRPGLVKPNHEELIAATGEDDPLRGAEELRAAGADAVVVSLGAAGLVCCTPEGRWRARLPERVSGNPVGAGDAAVAALVRGLVAGTPWPELLADAAALSSAAVRRPTAGDVDPETYRRLLADVHVQNV